ncbi:16S rRNA (cytosine1402-N4)-methyltransferase [Natranaerovirga hydrolytica]|uniref:Ribosomal RNA small subunit methyltransferase H n=1 Tax=Natranaerovirga hydrolytica TaxID=680378 RepID=A0A4R1MX71_9FIRM|nr:16S rRNA (cytosine(1402)-N(4))-methyltransferase RsmH [Natranaerovirga hydrolytica]TCK97858.1 16S rRNA (cytosine1402-N4)-methyltransferase [Natranaerovirga hydrolytica]
MEFKHVSVLLNETIEGLNIRPEGIYLDGTLGGGGHALEICKRLNEKGKFIGLDQDKAAIAASTERLKDYQSIISLHKSNYKDIQNVLDKEAIQGVDGIVLDLGVSSHQIDKAERGFSYKGDALLDMRMDQDKSITAKDIVNEYSEEKLFRVIKEYGEERFARRIASNIVKERTDNPILTTSHLVEIIKRSIPAKFRYNSGHPAKKTFQAIRIELNEELNVLKETLNTMIELLNDNGRIGIITFHSLEDRIVKNIFRDNQHPCTCPREFPVCICNKEPTGKVITRKPIIPSDIEIENNKRAKSAKLRIFEREKK